jgi:transcription termination factor 2
MGLGKTLTILAYLRYIKDDKEKIMQKKREKEEKKAKEEKNKHGDENDDDDEEALFDKKRIYKKKYETKYDDTESKRLRTLIILPASLLHQWQGEIKSKFSRDAFKFHVYHEANRKAQAYNLEDNDIVFTTYEIISREMDIFDKDGNPTVKSVRFILYTMVKRFDLKSSRSKYFNEK